ncbi:type VI secretion system baseplate subunit TssK [Candidatus Curculioniphilus buchneri]|uniref:type VI secretion system baseplate subunit TssK n=1 Tax=Candidatus Curculioniphilus buchneri TaxID=690594 RepID=UPI00376EBE6D
MIKNFDKVLWTEGMFLRPHHFQQFEAYLEARQWRLQSREYCWGFSSLVLDQGLLALGKIALTSAQGIFPDGTIFHFTDSKNAPRPLDIYTLHCGQIIVLALPIQHVGRNEVIFKDSDESLARYIAFEKNVTDSNAVSSEKATLYFGQLRLRLMPKNELNGDWLSLGVLRIKDKMSDGRIVLEESYIPPLINSDVNPLLSQYQKELSGLLIQRCQKMTRYLQKCGLGQETTSKLHLLNLLYRFSATVEHTLTLPRIHPERLFAEWIPFALELAVSQPPYECKDHTPRYDHKNIGGSFIDLMMLLRKGLCFILEENIVSLTLRQQMPGFNIATLPESGMYQNYDFVLAVQDNFKNKETAVHFLAQIKISATHCIHDLVQLQLPGLPLCYLSQAPKQLAHQPGWSYILLKETSVLWKDIENTKTLTIYVASEFSNVSIALWAIRRSSNSYESRST